MPGKRTGVSIVDRLSIIAHDRFQEIVDEANRSDSPIHLQTIILDPANDLQKTRTVFTQSNLAAKISGEPTTSPDVKGAAKSSFNQPTPMFSNNEERKVAEAVMSAIKNQEHLPSSSYLLKPDIQAKIAQEAELAWQSNQSDLPGIHDEVDIRKVVELVTKAVILETIDIPRILVVPKGQNAIGFKAFKLECSSVKFQPVERDLLIQHLRTNEQETITFSKAEKNEERLGKYLLISHDQVQDNMTLKYFEKNT